MTGQSRETAVKTVQNMCDVLDKAEDGGIAKGESCAGLMKELGIN